MSRYKKLIKVLLREIFTSKENDGNFVEQIILRYAFKDGYVELKDNRFYLSKKGEKLIKTEQKQ